MKSKIILVLLKVISVNKLSKIVRSILYPDGIRCKNCNSKQVIRINYRNKYPRRYECSKCKLRFSEWDNTILEDTKLPLNIAFLFIILVNYGMPILCIAYSFSITYKTAYKWYWRIIKNLQKIEDKPVLDGIVEADECYVTSGRKKEVIEDRKSRVRGLKQRGRGTMKKDKPPILGIVSRTSKKIRLFVCKNLKMDMVEKTIMNCVSSGSEIHTDGYEIYRNLSSLDFMHKEVIHSTGVYAEDQDGDGICEVHCNSVEGLWSLFRHFMRGFRGVNKNNLYGYVRLFEYLYNARVENKPIEQTFRDMMIIKN